MVLPKFKTKPKIEFVYISPLNKENVSTTDLGDEDESAFPQASVEKVNSEQISVKWDQFTKMKKKNYLEDYIFIKEIGKGAYGVVSKIKMKYGNFCRSAKVIKSSIITRENNNKSKFFSEISIPMKLDHPNIIKIF